MVRAGKFLDEFDQPSVADPTALRTFIEKTGAVA
jgi:hypothetical protein